MPLSRLSSVWSGGRTLPPDLQVRLEAVVTIQRWGFTLLPLLLLPLGWRFSVAAATGAGLILVLNLVVRRRLARGPTNLPVLGIRMTWLLLLSAVLVPINLLTGTTNSLNGIYILSVAVAAVSLGFRGVVLTAAAATAGMFGNAFLLHALEPWRTLKPALFGVVAYTLLIALAGSVALLIDRILRQYYERALVDTLTGCHNHGGFHVVLRRMAVPRAQPLSLVIVDLDHFKSVNDLYGHEVGNQVLQEIGARLSAVAPPTGVVARIGGEEFAVLLPDHTEEQAVAIADSLRRMVAAEPCILAGGASVSVTASAGVATLPPRNGNHRRLVAAADRAVYAAKHAGRNLTLTASSLPVASDALPPEEPVPVERINAWQTLREVLRHGIHGAYLGAGPEMVAVETMLSRVRWGAMIWPGLLLMSRGWAALPYALGMAALAALFASVGHVVSRENSPHAARAALMMRFMDATLFLCAQAMGQFVVRGLDHNGHIAYPILVASVTLGRRGAYWVSGYAALGTLAVNLIMAPHIGVTTEQALANGYLQAMIYFIVGSMGWILAGLTQESALRSVSDPLTHLKNQGFFRLRLHELLRANRRRPEAGALLLIDVDNLKEVNDSRGHSAGDQLLCHVAGAIRAILPSGAIAARYGGDEFAVLLPRATPEEARQFGLRLLAGLRPGDDPARVSIGVGRIVTEWSAERCLEVTDAAMYQAKRCGKNCVVGPLEPTSDCA